MAGHRVLVAMYLAAVIILSYSELKIEQRMPQPKKYLYATLVFLLLGFLEMLGAGKLAATFAVGAVLAMAYTYFVPGEKGILGNLGGTIAEGLGVGGSIVGSATARPSATKEMKPL